MLSVGIDLGTTNSVAAIYRTGIVEALQVDDSTRIPSVVYFKSPQEVIVGKKAKSYIKIYPEKIVRSSKRFMGDSNKYWEIDGMRYSPLDIATKLLRSIREKVAEHNEDPIKDSVITVPAYFTGLQKSLTKDAAEKAGLNVLAMLKEPTAAAIAYGIDKSIDQTVLVYDLGGGTFDVSILQVQSNKFNERAIDGDTFLGGDDFDNVIKQHIVEQFENCFKSFQLTPGDEKTISEVAETMKIDLSSLNLVRETVIIGDGKYTIDVELKRSEFIDLIQPKIDDTIKIVRRVLSKANMSKDDISRILLVGGSTKIPIIAERLSEEIKTPFMANDVDEIVAHGAAILANDLNRPTENTNENILPPIELSNITPYNLGLRVLENGNDDKFSILIPEQNAIPTSCQKIYSTHSDNQSAVPIGVFQGFGQNCSDADVNFVGGFILDGIPLAPANQPEIVVNFKLNENDILEVSAECSGVGVKSISLNINRTSDYNEVFQAAESTAVILCIDVSGSMSGRPITAAKEAAKAYVNRKNANTSIIGCVVFGSSGALVHDLTGDQGSLLISLDQIVTGYGGSGFGTNMQKGLKVASKLFNDSHTEYRKQIIVLSDGYTSGNVRSMIGKFKGDSVTIHTVGAGNNYDRALLEELASKTGGVFVAANDIATLVEAFISLVEK